MPKKPRNTPPAPCLDCPQACPVPGCKGKAGKGRVVCFVCSSRLGAANVSTWSREEIIAEAIAKREAEVKAGIARDVCRSCGENYRDAPANFCTAPYKHWGELVSGAWRPFDFQKKPIEAPKPERLAPGTRY